MTLWMFVDIVAAVLFAYLAFRMHRRKRPGMKWFFVAMAILWLGYAIGQWFRSHPGSWPF